MKPIYIISDTHFNHAAIKRYCNRPENCDELMINSMRSLPEGSLLIHLGDVIFNKASQLKEIMSGVKATKVLVRGNHDLEKDSWYYNRGFDFVCDLYAIGGTVFSHVPIEINSYFPQKMGWQFNVHGHLHNTDHRKTLPDINSYYDTKKHVLYAPELQNYKAVLLDDLLKERMERLCE